MRWRSAPSSVGLGATSSSLPPALERALRSQRCTAPAVAEDLHFDMARRQERLL